MNELLYTLRLMSARRGGSLRSVKSLYLNCWCDFGLPDLTELLPTNAGDFYYFPTLTIQPVGVVGLPRLGVTNSNRGSGLDLWLPASVQVSIAGFETDDFLYNVNTHSAGSFSIVGTVYQVSYS